MTENKITPDYMRDEHSYLAHVRALQDAAWPTGVPREPIFPLRRRPLTEYLREWARRQPDKAAIMFYGRAISYAELDRLSDRFASVLARLGARKGDRVAVFLPNCPQFYICFFGILKAGCVHVPVNPMFTRPEFVYEINDTQARIVIVHDRLAHLVGEVRQECGIEYVLVTSFLDALPAARQFARRGDWPPDVRDADLVVNATSVRDEVLVELARGQVLVDLPYPETATARAARASGVRVIGGLEVLVAQGAASFERWTGLPAPVDVMRAAVGATVPSDS